MTDEVGTIDVAPSAGIAAALTTAPVAAGSLVRALAESARRRHSQPPASESETFDAACAALFLAYCHRADPGAGHASSALACWQQAVEGIARNRLRPWLIGGFVGVAWVTEHIRSILPLDADEDPGADIDDVLLAALGDRPERFDFDLVTGLVGFGVYALERLPRPTARLIVEAVIAGLVHRAHADADGLTWPSPGGLRAPYERGGPDGQINVGLAHGSPGVLAFLASAWSAGFQTPEVRRLMEGAAAWLWAQRSVGPASWFPARRGPGDAIEPARTAWCYGDPGVAIALLLAGQALGSGQHVERAVSVARAIAAREEALCYAESASFCHGALGISHTMRRFAAASGDARFAAAAAAWQTRALGYVQAGVHDLQDTSLLEGISGMGLVLLGSLFSEGEPDGASGASWAKRATWAKWEEQAGWDRLVLMSLRGPL
jgi:lantibiotic biosynthesis protein